ncbi:alkyl hydroperoxide reductase [Methylobacterium sp. Leaf399]|uniref:thioredoxin family protein n=1 Tax=Methylobacterium sp. Leaf399 TaxID=1736364 RepID=UPI0006F7F92A|nr:thioredoxin family protein [Methylobacterium sp. Leaf399]KQT19568.1 alkyl hydroperoxide reductase [Methylobacterium sp. Leaf399]
MTTTRRRCLTLTVAAALLTLPLAAKAAGLQIGKPAPVFTATDADGKAVRLSDYAGKTVVLEWTNHDCPFVKKMYGGQAMQALQKKWTEAGVVWLTVISSAPGEQGAVEGQEANRLTQERGAAPTAVVLDTTGTVGKAYDARTTPQMVVITGDGTLVYNGAIDDKPTANLDDLKTAKNYVDAALTEVAAGKPVSVKTSKPYGCSVKYSS